MNDAALNINLDSRLAVNPNLVLRIEDDDCALLFDPDKGRVEMLNGTAVEIWQLLDGKRSLREVAGCLAERYEGFDATATGQLLAVVELLAGLGAVGIWEQD